MIGILVSDIRTTHHTDAIFYLERDLACSGGFDDGPAVQMGLAVLDHMELIEIDPEEARLSVPPGQKRRPEEDALFQRLTIWADYAAKKE